MDSAQYAELFLAESREHVSAVNTALLQLEQGRDTDDAIGVIFRSVHTIKGMSATMGYTPVARLSHELETLLDALRQGTRVVTAPLMDVLFRAADLLERSIEQAVDGHSDAIDVAPMVAQLRAEDALSTMEFQAITLPATSAAGTPAPAAAVAWTVSAPGGDGTLVRIRLDSATQLRGVRAFLALQAARGLGEVLAVSPEEDRLTADDFGFDFALRLRTTLPLADVDAALRRAGDVVEVRVGEDLGAADARPFAQSDGALRAQDASPSPTAAPRQRSIRIDLNRLDRLMNLIGELVITRGRLSQLASDLGDSALTDAVTQASRLIADLQDEIMTSRMVPVGQVFDRFPRLVRDAAHSVAKQVQFTIEGKDVELDRSMLDEVGDPIVHLLRNAVDHGIELPDDRAAAGKDRTGQLTLSALRDRSAVAIRVRDDGRGIDRARVLARAKASGLVEESRSELSDDELMRLISRAGFSTAERVTDLSGRGVGVDAVYNRVRSVGGSVDIRSLPGVGTTVTIRLPLTLAIVRALLARIGEETYAVPMTHVSQTVELKPELVRSLNGREVLTLRDGVLPLLRLRVLLGHVGEPKRGLEQVIIVDLGERRAALVVDALIGQQEIVVKQFDGVQEGLAVFGGATILGDGVPALILDIGSLL